MRGWHLPYARVRGCAAGQGAFFTQLCSLRVYFLWIINVNVRSMVYCSRFFQANSSVREYFISFYLIFVFTLVQGRTSTAVHPLPRYRAVCPPSDSNVLENSPCYLIGNGRATDVVFFISSCLHSFLLWNFSIASSGQWTIKLRALYIFLINI